MKATPYAKYRIPARKIAEMVWGGRSTHAYRCNRVGAYYYSCSGHGGYVVDSRCLSLGEMRKIKKYISAINIRLLVQERASNFFVIGASLLNFPRSGRHLQDNTSFQYTPRLGPLQWQDLPVFLFEEDCDWAILEKLTDIRAEGINMTEAERQKHINQMWRSYIARRE